MCEYCNIEKFKKEYLYDSFGNKCWWWEGIPLGGYEESIGSGDLELNPVDKVIAADSGVYFVKIKYCPMCGREL